MKLLDEKLYSTKINYSCISEQADDSALIS